MGILGANLQHAGVDYDYETSWCNGRCEYICRCRTITSVEITHIDLADLVHFYNKDEDRPLSVLDRYGIARILACAHLESDDFDINTVGGYYGEEIGSIKLEYDPATRIDEKVQAYRALPDDPTTRIEWLLLEEYGHVLDSLQGLTWSQATVPTDELVFGARDHYTRLDSKTVKAYRHMLKYQRAEDHEVPLGLVREDGSRYRVVDGYHRLSAAQQEGRDEVLVFIAQ